MADDKSQTSIIVKWGGKEYAIPNITDQSTLADLRQEIFIRTQVRPERQKLLNLRYSGATAPDYFQLCQLNLKKNFKIMMVGSTEKDIEIACSRPEDDAAQQDGNENEIREKVDEFENDRTYLFGIRSLVRDYVITELTSPRPGKRLLVLDLDNTIFVHRADDKRGTGLVRPFLKELLESAYEHYDIVIWSSTEMRVIEKKMCLIGKATRAMCKIWFFLDAKARLTTYPPGGGRVYIKALALIWGKYPQYSSKNTIMIDNSRQNFLFNPKSGLEILPFREPLVNLETDTELLQLAKYLRNIALCCNDFDQLNHDEWQKFEPESE